MSKLIKGGVGIKISRLEKFQKINNRGGWGGGNYSEPESTSKNKLKEHEEICNNHDSYRIEMPKWVEKILKYNPGEKSLKKPFAIYLDLERLLKKEQSHNNNNNDNNNNIEE